VELTATLSISDATAAAAAATAERLSVNADYDSPPLDGMHYKRQLAEKKRASGLVSRRSYVPPPRVAPP
jgi:hypothetical protein